MEEDKEVTDEFGWFRVIEKLAQGDILRIEAVTQQPLYTALNLLSYWKAGQI